jgi:hypothetical protein
MGHEKQISFYVQFRAVDTCSAKPHQGEHVSNNDSLPFKTPYSVSYSATKSMDLAEEAKK